MNLRRCVEIEVAVIEKLLSDRVDGELAQRLAALTDETLQPHAFGELDGGEEACIGFFLLSARAREVHALPVDDVSRRSVEETDPLRDEGRRCERWTAALCDALAERGERRDGSLLLHGSAQ
jgi:hypothetical protein